MGRLNNRRLISGMYNWSDMTFAVRRNVILMHLDALRCILLYDRLIVLVPDGADQLLHDLENKITEAKTQQTVFFGKAYLLVAFRINTSFIPSCILYLHLHV